MQTTRERQKGDDEGQLTCQDRGHCSESQLELGIDCHLSQTASMCERL